jgi:hypothetical protein
MTKLKTNPESIKDLINKERALIKERIIHNDAKLIEIILNVIFPAIENEFGFLQIEEIIQKMIEEDSKHYNYFFIEQASWEFDITKESGGALNCKLIPVIKLLTENEMRRQGLISCFVRLKEISSFTTIVEFHIDNKISISTKVDISQNSVGSLLHVLLLEKYYMGRAANLFIE